MEGVAWNLPINHSMELSWEGEPGPVQEWVIQWNKWCNAYEWNASAQFHSMLIHLWVMSRHCGNVLQVYLTMGIVSNNCIYAMQYITKEIVGLGWKKTDFIEKAPFTFLH